MSNGTSARCVRSRFVTDTVAPVDGRQFRDADLVAGCQTTAALSLAVRIEERLTSEEGDNQLLVQLLPMLGLAQARGGDAADAADTLERAVETAEAANDRYARAIALIAWDELDELAGNPPADRRAEATQILEQLDVVGLPALLSRRRVAAGDHH